MLMAPVYTVFQDRSHIDNARVHIQYKIVEPHTMSAGSTLFKQASATDPVWCGCAGKIMHGAPCMLLAWTRRSYAVMPV